jgi:hypothetical protein
MADGSLPSIPITCRDLRGPEGPPQFSFDRAFYFAASRSSYKRHRPSGSLPRQHRATRPLPARAGRG